MVDVWPTSKAASTIKSRADRGCVAGHIAVVLGHRSPLNEVAVSGGVSGPSATVEG